MHFPSTSLNLLSKLKSEDQSHWQISWKRFLELYHLPLQALVRHAYRHHTGGQEPATGFVEDAVANTVRDFFSKSQHHFDPAQGRLRSYLATIANRRVIDLLRKERPLNHHALNPDHHAQVPDETPHIRAAFYQSLLATLLEDLRNQVPLRQFEIFERVKLKYQSPEYVAEEFGITRAMVDRNIYKVMTRLRVLASQPEYQSEFQD